VLSSDPREKIIRFLRRVVRHTLLVHTPSTIADRNIRENYGCNSRESFPGRNFAKLAISSSTAQYVLYCCQFRSCSLISSTVTHTENEYLVSFTHSCQTQFDDRSTKWNPIKLSIEHIGYRPKNISRRVLTRNFYSYLRNIY